MKIFLRALVVTGAFSVPAFVFAQAGGISTTYIKPYADSIVGIINGIIVPVILALAFLVFLWGIYKYFILGATNEESLKEGRQLVIWGILGFVIIFTLWAIVNMLMSTLGLNPNTPAPNPPTFNPSGSQSGTYNSSSGTSGRIQCTDGHECPSGQTCTLGVCSNGTGIYQ